MDNRFAGVPQAEIQRSSFDRSHGHKTTFDAGLMIPILMDEVLPGDTVNLSMSSFVRLATPLKPVMDNCYLDTFFFFVPNRLTWSTWEAMNGQQEPPTPPNPPNPPSAPVPFIDFDATVPAALSIYDYAGVPLNGVTIEDGDVIALPFRGYNLIWRDWFRDQNLQSSPFIYAGDTDDLWSSYALLPRAKRHDYFTSALPWPQKGAAVSLPLGSQAPVAFPTAIQGGTIVGLSIGDQDLYARDLGGGFNTLTDGPGTTPLGSPEAAQIRMATPSDAYADLSAATAANVNDLRLAFQLQKLLERDARSGTRYIEVLKAHFGVTNPDFRLQRPEYLGGSTTRCGMVPVPQTGEGGSGTNTPQGNLSAFGVAQDVGHAFTHSFTEHGWLIGLVCVRADLNYQQGLNRKWGRRTRFDYFWPVLANLGEQEILNKELFYDDDGDNNEVFGYQERWAEYRYAPSIVTGQFRSSHPTSLDLWHYAQDFSARPNLNADFIVENPPIARTIAVPTEPQFLGDFWFNAQWVRPMPLYSVPGMIDHF